MGLLNLQGSSWKVYQVHGEKRLQKSQDDHMLYIKHSTHGKVFTLIVYKDDILITGDDLSEIEKLKSYLAAEFELKSTKS